MTAGAASAKMSTMGVWVGSEVERFAAGAGPLLEARIEHNVLATVLDGVRSGRYREAMFAVIGDASGVTRGAALRTPPHHLLIAGELPDPEAFLSAWLARDPEIPGVAAEPVLAHRLAGAWTVRTGGSVMTGAREALHVLDRVRTPAGFLPGRLRLADWRETTQLADWGAAFARDTGLAHPEAAAAGVVDAIEEGRLYVWENREGPVSMAAHSVAVAGAVRIGPVFTPGPLRGHGYGTAVTAALSRLLLAVGAERCMLYSDLENPVSNHIYAKVGYVEIGRWEQLNFAPAD